MQSVFPRRLTRFLHLLIMCMLKCAQVASEAADMETYFCSALRLMPLANIDPSLAIGFYCRSPGTPLSILQEQCITASALMTCRALPAFSDFQHWQTW